MRGMESNEMRVEAVFDGQVFRPNNDLELMPDTQVVLTVTVVDGNTATRQGLDTVKEPTLFAPQETTYLVIPEDADLREVAVNYWPKEGVAGASVRRRSVSKVPARQQPPDDSDLLIMDDADGLQN